jgi:hypothetical protein
MSCKSGVSDTQKQPGRVFNALLDRDQESHGFAAVNDAMIIGMGDVHHRPDHDLAVFRHWAILSGVHAENAALRRIEDRRRHQRAKHRRRW